MRNFENGHKIKNFEIACSYMEKVFYSLFHPQKSSALLREQEWHPFTNVYELASEILIEIELAGIKESDVQINFKENYLIIKGTRKERRRGANILYHQMEVEYGPFERIIYVPFKVNAQKIHGIYEDRFLMIKLPKCSQNF